MKKIYKIITGLALSSVLLTGCGKKTAPTTEGYQSAYNTPGENKTKIRVKNFGGGIGHIWIDKAADKFAQANMETSFEPGKKGVYIEMENTFEENTASMDNGAGKEIYFDERMSDITELAGQNKLLCLDDIYNDETRVGGALKDKIFPAAKQGVQLNGHYYGLPHYEYFGGLTYNVKVFNDVGAYFASNDAVDGEDCFIYEPDGGKFGNAKIIADVNDSPRSVGPDGLPGTEDDGLPRTLQEFLILCSYLKDNDVSPLVISGDHATRYGDYLVSGFWANLAGVEQMKNYYNLSGTIDIVERDDQGNLKFTDENLFPGISYIKKPVIKSYTFKGDGTDGYLGQDMVAKFYAYALMEIAEKEGFWDLESTRTSDHYEAQKHLIFYKVPRTSYTPVGMLVDGSYLYNEANEHGTLSDYKKYTGSETSTIDCRFMSLPTTCYNPSNLDDYVGKEQCLLDIGQAYGMINRTVESNPGLKRACVEFVSFIYSDAELCEFTKTTGLTRMISCSLTKDDIPTTTGTFFKELYKIRKENGSNIVATGSTFANWSDVRNLLTIAMGKSPLTNLQKQTAWLLAHGGSHAGDMLNAFSTGIKTTWIGLDKSNWNL